MTKSLKLENSINTKNIEKKNWDSNPYFPYQCSPLTLTHLLCNRFQIIYSSIKDYKNFSQHLFQLKSSHKNKLLKGTFKSIQPPLILNDCLLIKIYKSHRPWNCRCDALHHCIQSVPNSPRDHHWSRPKNFYQLYQQLTLFLNITFKTISRKKKLYRRTSPPEIGAERWASNTSTMSKRRMSLSLSSLQTSYTVSFG